MKKYIVILVVDREINILGAFGTYEEAFDTMKKSFVELVEPDMEDLEAEGTDWNDWEIGQFSAWANSPCNGSCDDYDWKIIEVMV